jgi:hypothetical protein
LCWQFYVCLCEFFDSNSCTFYVSYSSGQGRTPKDILTITETICPQWLCFLAHLSWKLKWAFLIARCPASVCLSVCLSVNFYIFDFFSRTTGPILNRLGTNHPWVKGIQICSKEGDSPSPRGDNIERVKIHWKFSKVFFFRTSRPISIKLGTNYPWVKGIQVCSDKGPGPL